MKSIESLLNKSEWHKIDWKSLTLSDFKAQDKNGETILHKALRLEKLGTIPKEFICDELLKIKNKEGNSIYFLAAGSIEGDLIPKELLVKEVLLEKNNKGETTLCAMIKNEATQRIAKNFIYSDILLERCESMGTTYLHLCATAGELKKLPKEYYLKKLALQDENKDTLLHKLAEEDRLWEIPEESRDPALIEITNSYHQNPLHKIVDLDDVPKEFLTPKALEAQDWKGQTPVYRSTWINGIEHLPTECLTEKALTTPTHDGQTPLSNILSDYDGKYKEKYLTILKNISKKTLEKLALSDTTSKAKLLIISALKAHNFKEKIMLKSNEKTLKIDI
jgi:hypothetical protein